MFYDIIKKIYAYYFCNDVELLTLDVSFLPVFAKVDFDKSVFYIRNKWAILLIQKSSGIVIIMHAIDYSFEATLFSIVIHDMLIFSD